MPGLFAFAGLLFAGWIFNKKNLLEDLPFKDLA